MELLIWIGAAVSLLGILGLFYCILQAAKAKSAGLSDEDMRARLKQVVALNLAALMVSALGLISVIVGIVLS